MHSITKSNERLFRQTYEQMCATIRATTMVDIGSDNGKYSKQIAKLVRAKTVICVDHDRKALLRAKKRGCHTIQADLNQKISLPSNSADLVIINQVIEHVAKTDLLVKEVKRILKPQGVSIWCTPNLASWHNIVALMVGYQPFSSQVSDERFIGNPWHPDYSQIIKEEQAHLRLFTRQSLRELLTLHGLVITTEKGVGYYSPLPFLSKTLSWLDPIHAAYLFTVAKKN